VKLGRKFTLEKYWFSASWYSYKNRTRAWLSKWWSNHHQSTSATSSKNLGWKSMKYKEQDPHKSYSQN